MNPRYLLAALAALWFVPSAALAQAGQTFDEVSLRVNNPQNLRVYIDNCAVVTPTPPEGCPYFPLPAPYPTPDTSVTILLGYSVFSYPDSSTTPPTIRDAGVEVTDPPVTGNLALTQPVGACTPITNAAEVAGKIAFISRGGNDGTMTDVCGFYLKAQNAQAAGAIGVLIYNNADRPPPETVAGMSGGDSNTVDIPALLILRSTAQPILDYIRDEGGTVNVSLGRIFCKCIPIEPGPNGTPGTHSLSAASPNPFNPSTQFTLEVAAAQHVTVELYNMLGQRVAVLFDGPVTPGAVRTLRVDGSALASGLYVARVTGETFADAVALSLVK